MAKVSTYLNFSRRTEEAFNFYKSVFGTEFNGQGIMCILISSPIRAKKPDGCSRRFRQEAR